MLIIKDKAPSAITHEFLLTNVITTTENTFELTSQTIGLTIPFTLEAPIAQIPPNYSVTVHLFKNIFHSQKDIIDIRVDGLNHRNGKIGYFFRLDALFEKDFLQIDQHIYPYAYLGLNYIFSRISALQTKDAEVSSEDYEISHFFDDDTIILVLCNEYCANIPNFNIENYLAQLFLCGFISFNKANAIETVNATSFIESNYVGLKAAPSPTGVYVMRISKANDFISGETYITYLFRNLIQKQTDPITRFIMLYQVVEIFIGKLFHHEIQNKVCNNLFALDTYKLKDIMGEMQKQKNLIRALFNRYSRPTPALENTIKAKLVEFFVHILDSDYNDPAENATLTITDLFYDYRNKLIHQYRLIHNTAINAADTNSRIDEINQFTEALMAEVISNFNT
jgi:hypothetical protein